MQIKLEDAAGKTPAQTKRCIPAILPSLFCAWMAKPAVIGA